MPSGAVAVVVEVHDAEERREGSARRKHSRVEHPDGGASTFEKVSSGESITRHVLEQFISNKVDEHDSYYTLPVAVLYMVVLVLFIGFRLRIEDRFDVEASVVSWVDGTTPGYTARDFIRGRESYWAWLKSDYGIAHILSSLGRSDNNVSFVDIADRSKIAGQIFMTGVLFDASSTRKELVRGDDGKAYFADGKFDKAVIANIEALQADPWWQQENLWYIQIEFISYDEWQMMLTHMYFTTSFETTGSTVVKMEAKGIPLPLYPSTLEYIWDTLFALLVFRSTYVEALQIVHILRYGGFSALRQDFGFFQLVDWSNIVFAFTCASIWLKICTGVTTLNQTLTPHLKDGWVTTDWFRAPEEDLGAIWRAVEPLESDFAWLKIITCLSVGTNIATFFKGFHCNPRLCVVTKTLHSAAVDITHYVLIFATIFLPFSLSGHILFGRDIKEFSSAFASMSTTLTTLLGDFGWYTDLVDVAQWNSLLPSGMPLVILTIWFVSFEFIVFLVLLNLLLAILIQYYANVSGELRRMPDAPSIWVQSRRVADFLRATKTFKFSLEKLDSQLQDEAHPTDIVTKESLMESFLGMSEAQATFLLEHCRRYMKLRGTMNHDEENSLADHHLSSWENMCARLVARTEEIIQSIPLNNEPHRADCIVPPFETDDLVTKLEKIDIAIGKVEHNQGRLNKRIEAVLKMVVDAVDETPNKRDAEVEHIVTSTTSRRKGKPHASEGEPHSPPEKRIGKSRDKTTFL